MTNEQAKKMLKAKLECLKHETSGMYSDCNRCNCDECSLNYEQGNMGEQKEALDMAIKALRADAVDRQSVIDSLYDWADHSMTDAEAWHLRQVAGDIKSMGAADEA